MQQRAKSLIARQYYKNKYGTQLIEDDNFLNVQVGDDNQLQTRQVPTIVINSDDEQQLPQVKQVKVLDTLVKQQDLIVQKNEERNSVSQLQTLLSDNPRASAKQSSACSALDCISQLQKSLSQMNIQQPQLQTTSYAQEAQFIQQIQPFQQKQQKQQIQQIQQTQQSQQSKKRVINIPDIQTKMNIESDEEEPASRAPRKQVRINDDETLPSIQFKKKADIFTTLPQKLVKPIDDKTALQMTYHYKQRQEEEIIPQIPETVNPVSYQDFIAMKNREINAAKQQKQDEEYRKKLILDKKHDKIAPEKIREGETFQQYQQRMVQYIQKQNKYKNKRKYKKGTDWENQKTAEEKQKINELIKIINPEFQVEDEEKPKKPDILNYDVLLKNGLILKQAFAKPPEPDLNPMLQVYKKGRYATEFIFNGGIDLEDGPYGQQTKKKSKKLPFPKHRLSLSPWEYYGVGPEEYFATKNPNFEFKQKYVPVKDYYNEMPRPKQNPKYYCYDIDQLLSKRFQSTIEEAQYQTSFIGYKQRHWTPVSHLKAVCPNMVMEYEKYERDRLFCYIANVKLSKVALVPDVCILTAKFTKQKIENTLMTYWKRTTGGPQTKKTISNLERQVADDQPKLLDEMDIFTKDDDEEEKEKKKKISKEQRHLEDEWDPSKDDTARAQRNKLRKEKFIKIAEELKVKQSQKKEKVKISQPKEQELDGTQLNQELQQHENKKEKKKAKRQRKQKKEENQAQAQLEANQFEEQFYQQKDHEKQEQIAEEENQEIYQEPEDLVYRAKLKEWNTKRLNLTGTEVDMQESLKLIYPQQQQPKLDSERYKIFMPK